MKNTAMIFSIIAAMFFVVQSTVAQTPAGMDPHSDQKTDRAADASSQDPAKIDARHYKIDFENDQIRVLRISYGPGEKSVMHHHPAGIAVFLTDGKGKFTYPDGTTEEMEFKAGQTVWLPAQHHQPANPGDEPFELIQIEMKNPPVE